MLGVVGILLILILKRQRSAGLCEFEATLDYPQDSQKYIVRLCLKLKQSNKPQIQINSKIVIIMMIIIIITNVPRR